MRFASSSPSHRCGNAAAPDPTPLGRARRRQGALTAARARATWEWEHTSFCLTFRLRCLSECRGDSNVLLAYATSHWALAIGFSPPHLNKKIERRHGPVAGTRTDD